MSLKLPQLYREISDIQACVFLLVMAKEFKWNTLKYSINPKEDRKKGMRENETEIGMNEQLNI